MSKQNMTPSLSDTVRRAIERSLLDGAILPGQIFDERSLAEKFGVSRTPVREAILRLVALGLLQVMPRAGVVVPKLSIKELLSLLEMLAELEGVCAKFAAKRINGEQRKALREALMACEAAATAKHAEDYKDANTRFHEIIYEASKNDWATSQVRALRLRCASYQRSRFDLPGRLDRSLREHAVVVERIEAGDEEGARLAMVEHISVGGRDFAEFVSSVPTDFLSGE
ncbi:GntR family transcriptional regulator [Noviherbaspirillum saxi]|uniref:GntR family transcriptional regulator n=1 Tax=Noviherbaspirillum saxi TaxID=2320863 RepID=A0A3A3FK00_9BURK|nr:GntR family transcriptional regulator [Noviherbaspirillum saxi]RJF95627.1 GntR family transcriptional regulator [Noviherbaspirillum saxi]